MRRGKKALIAQKMFKTGIRSHTVLYLSKITYNAYICTYRQFNEVIKLKMIMLSMRAIDYLDKRS